MLKVIDFVQKQKIQHVLKSNIMLKYRGQNKTQSYLELMNGKASKQN